MEKIISRKEAKKIYLENNKKVMNNTLDGFVVLKNIGKVYNNRVQAVYNFNISIKKNEFIVLVGPSGCGKSTTLRMIAGLEEITDGQLYIDGMLANYLESKDRDIAMVFQSYALYPNMTVFDNIGFGLSVRGESKEVIREKVFDAAKILDLGEYLDRKPKELSGGQMQRVALGRAIVRNAKLFLMDEPLSNLDAKLRVQMRSEIVRLHREVGATTIYVTHDQTEAMTMADRIVVMNKGFVQQIGTPIEIYNNPSNVFVATFIGNPPMNVFAVNIEENIIKDDNNSLTIPEDYAVAHKEYIKNQQNYFEKMVKNADEKLEKDIIEKIEKFLSKYKKLSTEERESHLNEIIQNLTDLSLQKEYIPFSNEEKEELIKASNNDDRKMLKCLLHEIIKRLKQSDLVVSAMLKQVESAYIANKKEEKTIKKPAKEKRFSHKSADFSLEEENISLAKKYFNEYKNELANHKVLFGVRPENIHFYDEFTGNASETFCVKVEFVELLGSEYCIHFNLFGSRLIMKSSVNRLVKIGEEIKVCFDMDKIKLFDFVSGNLVCGK